MHGRLLLGEHCPLRFSCHDSPVRHVIHPFVHEHVVNRGHWHMLVHSFARSVREKVLVSWLTRQSGTNQLCAESGLHDVCYTPQGSLGGFQKALSRSPPPLSPTQSLNVPVLFWKRMFFSEHRITNGHAITVLTSEKLQIMEVDSEHSAARRLSLSRAEKCPCGGGPVNSPRRDWVSSVAQSEELKRKENNHQLRI